MPLETCLPHHTAPQHTPCLRTSVEGGLRYFYATSEDESNPLARARLRGLDKRLLNQNTVRQLEMSEAKALLEALIKSPTTPIIRSAVEHAADDLLRDEFGILDF